LEVVVDRLVLGQGGAQMRWPRIRTRSRTLRRKVPTTRSRVAFIAEPDGGAHDRCAGGLEDGVERDREVEPRSRIRYLKPGTAPGSRARLRACCTIHSLVAGVMPPRCIRQVPCSMSTNTHSCVSSAVPTRKVDGQDPGGLVVQELQPRRLGRRRAIFHKHDHFFS